MVLFFLQTSLFFIGIIAILYKSEYFLFLLFGVYNIKIEILIDNEKNTNIKTDFTYNFGHINHHYTFNQKKRE